ncbi:MAG: chromate transporter [Actinobacteria bacterium]|nr:chromate transporter [Actinomycetota bacterium]
MIYVELFITFFKIGVFCFGGGYGMIPMIEREIEIHHWLTSQEFVNIISISEMTPGPIAINTATFVGYKMGGISGGLLATTGVVLPSLILVLSAFYFLSRFQHHPIVKDAIWGIRAVTLALVIGAIVFVARNVLFNNEINIQATKTIEAKARSTEAILNMNSITNLWKTINPISLGIVALALVMLLRFKIHPILTILIGGVIGIILHYIGVL